MAKKPDTPCAACGKMLWSAPTSLPAGQRMCRDCRGAERFPRSGEDLAQRIADILDPELATRRVAAKRLASELLATIAQAGYRLVPPTPECIEGCGRPPTSADMCSECKLRLDRQGARDRREARYGANRKYRGHCNRCGLTMSSDPRSNVDPSERMCRPCRRELNPPRGNRYYSIKITELGDRDLWLCHLCGAGVDRELRYPDRQSASFDHVLPRSRGGSDDEGNLKLAHWICNVRRGARDLSGK